MAKKATFDTFLSVCKPNTFRDMVKWGHSREQKMRICYCVTLEEEKNGRKRHNKRPKKAILSFKSNIEFDRQISSDYEL